MLSLGGVAEMQAAENKYAAIVNNGGWPKVPKGAYKKGSDDKPDTTKTTGSKK